MRPQSQIEVLAPVGNRAMLQAAVAAGADAVYLAAKSFGARAYADNFDAQELRESVLYAHLHRCRVYVTMNTLIKEQELDEALRQAKWLEEIGVDALIVQDFGFLRALKRAVPTLSLHGSTQMSVTGLAGAQQAEKLGLQRIVIGREASVSEIRRICDNTNLEIEVFVHGSLCVSVSGQCLMSSFAGGRSGNRGRCAQPCRKEYVFERGNGQRIGAGNAYLSPRDLCTAEQVVELAGAGVTSLKIEGRMKKPEYVFEAVRTYRQARCGTADTGDLTLTTNRPFTKGFLFSDFGTSYWFDHSEAPGRAVGTVEREGKKCFFRAREALETQDILSVQGRKRRLPLTVTGEIKVGEKYDLSRYADAVMGSEVRKIYTNRPRVELERELLRLEQEKRGIEMHLRFFVGEPARLSASCDGVSCAAEGAEVARAKNSPITRAQLAHSLSKVGNTPFRIQRLDIETDEAGFAATAQLNALRREALQGLQEAISRSRRISVCREEGKSEDAPPRTAETARTNSKMHPILCLETDRMPEAFPKQGWPDRVYVHSTEAAAAWNRAGVSCYRILPRLYEGEEERRLSEELFATQDLFEGISCSSIQDFSWMEKPWRVPKAYSAEASLHLMNREAVRWAEESGCTTLAASVEMTRDELKALSDTPLELLVYGRFCGMLLKHCPASALKGCTDETHCAACPYRRDLYLCDEYGRREVIRKNGYSEVLLPEAVDWRPVSEEMRALSVSGVRVVDHGEAEIGEVLLDWRAWCAGEKMCSRSFRSGNSNGRSGKRSLGHWKMAME
ncbi:MAG: DUF3656 domain-containing protein [Ndongobacter sp.]|nr:DUF3656 domain-containing protein [Ndongobacter sp.]